MQVTAPVGEQEGAARAPARAVSPPRWAGVVAWGSLAVTVLATAAAAVLDAVTPASARAAADLSVGWVECLPGVALGIPGTLLLRRVPRNAVSWVLAGVGTLWALEGLAQSWLTFALQGDPPLPGASFALWFVARFGAVLLSGLPLLLLLYPEGRLPTGRWRPLSLAALAALALHPLLLSVAPSAVALARDDERLPEVYAGLDLDPVSLPLPASVAQPLLQAALPLAVLGVLVPAAGVAARLRRARGEDRRRMR
ncbi:hypothetical protein ACU610_11470 [Geodermatophilus sp. URMC 61]|uniref:hypothetical protein n=1 Tax=Geodermatophilus sp. URMC 61 TaxID=3423411 RepID=UPI00406CBF97